MSQKYLTFYEFFAGGGMARMGLGPHWRCLLANEWCAKKAEAYRANHHPNGELVVDDVANLTTNQIPGQAILTWASFPCQDLSLAGNGHGLKGERSGTFWPFWRLMADLSDEGRPVPIIILENVVGALTSNNGVDFQTIADVLLTKGYLFGPMVIDAVHFVPQSRPRLFIIAVKADTIVDPKLISEKPIDMWHTKPIMRAFEALNEARRKYWIWWKLPAPETRRCDLSDVIEKEPIGAKWHSATETERLLGMMSEANLRKVKQAQKKRALVIGTIYKRTRKAEDGLRRQRAEVRFDQISGCLRTPVGGSSRQIIMLVEGERIRTRLITPREAARLMGLHDDYVLPDKYNDAYHLVGDGLAVPVVSHLAENLITPIAEANIGKAT